MWPYCSQCREVAVLGDVGYWYCETYCWYSQCPTLSPMMILHALLRCGTYYALILLHPGRAHSIIINQLVPRTPLLAHHHSCEKSQRKKPETKSNLGPPWWWLRLSYIQVRIIIKKVLTINIITLLITLPHSPVNCQGCGLRPGSTLHFLCVFSGFYQAIGTDANLRSEKTHHYNFGLPKNLYHVLYTFVEFSGEMERFGYWCSV